MILDLSGIPLSSDNRGSHIIEVCHPLPTVPHHLPVGWMLDL
jgi:hypothetical protein